MIVPRYWVRDKQPFPDPLINDTVGCWGWSETSEAEARERSQQATGRLVAWLQQLNEGKNPDHWLASWYGYDARPAREEVVEEFRDDAGETAAMVTRNSYGCLVLNTRDLVFVDADIPPQPTSDGSLVGMIKGLFGRTPTKDGTPLPSQEAQLKQRILAWADDRPNIALRLYRTAAGFRGMITNRAINAAHAEAESLLDSLPTDPLYRMLCKSQQCYRARLTPKPWRVGVRPPRQRFPWANATVEQAFRAWQRGYEDASSGFATCQLVEQRGPDEVLPELAPLVELHDRICLKPGPSRLA